MILLGGQHFGECWTAFGGITNSPGETLVKKKKTEAPAFNDSCCNSSRTFFTFCCYTKIFVYFYHQIIRTIWIIKGFLDPHSPCSSPFNPLCPTSLDVAQNNSPKHTPAARKHNGSRPERTSNYIVFIYIYTHIWTNEVTYNLTCQMIHKIKSSVDNMCVCM